jgi:hypothetical protein
MSGSRLLFAAVLVFSASVGSSFAEDSVAPGALSQFERTMAQKLIDRLQSDSERAYSDELSLFAEDFVRLGLDTKPVLTAVRAAAGGRSEFLEKVLREKCLAQGGIGNFCAIAQADEGGPNTSEVSTAATAAGGAVGGALSGTGTTGSSAVNTGTSGGSDSAVKNTLQSFGNFGGTGGSFVENGGTVFVTNTIAVPGPTAGAGLAGVAIMGAGMLVSRRKGRGASGDLPRRP